MNHITKLSSRLGLSMMGAEAVTIRGRSSGRPRSFPLVILKHGGGEYLVAPRGQTDWARNLRAAGEATTRVGFRKRRIRAAELPDDEKPPVLQAYLKKNPVTGPFFKPATAKSPVEEFREAASRIPVFRVELADGAA